VSRSRFEQLPGERKQEILRVAAEEFARGGFHGTSYNQLLARLGIGKGSAYYYFDDKQDLFLTVVKSCYLTFFATLKGKPLPNSVGTFWEYVDQLTVRGMNFMHDDPVSAALLQTFAKERFRPDVLTAPELLKSIGDTYGMLIRLGQQLGAVRTDLPFELLLSSVQAVAGAFDQWFAALGARPDDADLAKIASHSTSLIRGMVAPR
jgi:AcrR family transcriptional regulator